MKKIAMILIAMVMVFAAVPVNALENSDVVQAEEFILPENVDTVGVLVKCNGCGNGYANILCQGVSHTESAGACTWSSHENLGCSISNIYKYHNGNCGVCGKLYYSSSSMPYHKHSQLHSYSAGGSEEFVSCIYM